MEEKINSVIKNEVPVQAFLRILLTQLKVNSSFNGTSHSMNCLAQELLAIRLNPNFFCSEFLL
jgi:hypothetical protein